MLPIIGPKIALNMFKLSVSVTDTRYSRTSNGEDARIVTGMRTIKAAVDPSNSSQLEHMFGGSMTDGDIVLYTKETLSFVDEHENSANQQQSFLLYGCKLYRVVNFSNWAQQTGVNVYLARRHTSITAAL